mmetsp:Transcript_24095/g.46232  ORF Transcript_24095/g.46232 Transcript_24095/m.46232 type:complete len:210 (+) Transcript_24095:172-801(+)
MCAISGNLLRQFHRTKVLLLNRRLCLRLRILLIQRRSLQCRLPFATHRSYGMSLWTSKNVPIALIIPHRGLNPEQKMNSCSTLLKTAVCNSLKTVVWSKTFVPQHQVQLRCPYQVLPRTQLQFQLTNLPLCPLTYLLLRPLMHSLRVHPKAQLSVRHTQLHQTKQVHLDRREMQRKPVVVSIENGILSPLRIIFAVIALTTPKLGTTRM